MDQFQESVMTGHCTSQVTEAPVQLEESAEQRSNAESNAPAVSREGGDEAARAVYREASQTEEEKLFDKVTALEPDRFASLIRKLAIKRPEQVQEALLNVRRSHADAGACA